MTNKVNAISTWNYPLTQTNRQLETDGYDRKIYTGSGSSNIILWQDFVQKNSETIKRSLCVLIKTKDFIAKNSDETQHIMSAATKRNKKLICNVRNAFNYQVVPNKTLLTTLENETKLAQKNKLADRTVIPDYLSFIHLGSLKKAVKPEAIRMDR